MAVERIVVIGASAGGVGALERIAAALPEEFAAPILIVLHVAATQTSLLPRILSSAGPLRATSAVSGEELKPSRIYVAPADHHLLVRGDQVIVTRGPRENDYRPSIDVLFRSAAYYFGSRAIGVVLSGLLSDGSSGLYAIKRLGGMAAVQDPEEAAHNSMPRTALERVDIDYALPASEIGLLLQALVHAPYREEPIDAIHYRKELKADIEIASSDSAFEKGIMKAGEPSTYTCPECHGVLFHIREGNAGRFRCHTGHGFSRDALLEELRSRVEVVLWQALKTLQETTALIREAAAQVRDSGNRRVFERLDYLARQMGERVNVVRAMALEQADPDDDYEEGGR